RPAAVEPGRVARLRLPAEGADAVDEPLREDVRRVRAGEQGHERDLAAEMLLDDVWLEVVCGPAHRVDGSAPEAPDHPGDADDEPAEEGQAFEERVEVVLVVEPEDGVGDAGGEVEQEYAHPSWIPLLTGSIPLRAAER